MRSIKPIRMKKMVRANKAKHLKESKRAVWWTGTPAVAASVMGLTIVAVVGAVFASSDGSSSAGVRTEPNEMAQGSDPVRFKPPVRPSRTAGERAVVQRPVADTAATETAPAPAESSVTITGCLERSDEAFRIKDAAGADLPRARSWKSGFLKKSSPSVAVVSAANRVNLAKHNGERVSVTGTMVNREMRVVTLQRVAASCSGAPASGRN
jgi:hypothetical protein